MTMLFKSSNSNDRCSPHVNDLPILFDRVWPNVAVGQVSALWDYRARTEDNTTFDKGDMMSLNDASDEDSLNDLERSQIEGKVLTALWNYKAKTENDITFHKGDKMILIDDR
ncbi:hypothetical protein LOTGIDRAFT_167836 [Lottia gigantea]|uniref:SH3 domain-containing protein n=1 Tax=Lottia gigantea TaxID=225164 RepID=V3ZRT2_LOTGI|nr:hypothetical protein LOTGIDRAFT_167836 [Lottia gigantea]ESO85260.1 hypothetical protein LOTGIDRAFT_167836 [Lottia gigantea]